MSIATVWIKPTVHRALKLAAANEGKTMGEIVEECLVPRIKPFLAERNEHNQGDGANANANAN